MTTETTLPPNQEFDDAFRDLVSPDKGTAATTEPVTTEPAPAATTTEPVTTEPAPAAATAEPVTTEPAPAAATAEPATTEPAPATATTPAAATPEINVADELAKLRQHMESRLPAVETPAVAEPAAEPLYTAEEQAVLDKYAQDWPDVRQAEALMRRAEYKQLVGHIFDEIGKVIAPLTENYQQTQENDHFSPIYEAHGDYDTVKGKVIAWVNEQSPARQRAYGAIVSDGTADEIIDLVSLWKESTGYVQPATANNGQPPATPAVTAAPKVVASTTPAPAAKQAAQKLSVVETKRGAMPSTGDPADFDSAFVEFAKKA